MNNGIPRAACPVKYGAYLTKVRGGHHFIVKKDGKEISFRKEVKQYRWRYSPKPFDDKADWLFWYLWHHEGRRMRIGAAMMGADYA